jgi:hypothetical protein
LLITSSVPKNGCETVTSPVIHNSNNDVCTINNNKLIALKEGTYIIKDFLLSISIINVFI